MEKDIFSIAIPRPLIMGLGILSLSYSTDYIDYINSLIFVNTVFMLSLLVDTAYQFRKTVIVYSSTVNLIEVIWLAISGSIDGKSAGFRINLFKLVWLHAGSVFIYNVILIFSVNTKVAMILSICYLLVLCFILTRSQETYIVVKKR